MRLLGKWQRLASSHVMLGAGCSCGSPVTSVRIQDFEHDILAYLQGRHGAAARAASINELLSAIGRQQSAAAPEAQLALLSDLERSVDSFEELH